MTQEALARAASLTAKFVSQIENGRVNPSIAVLARLVNNGLRTTFSVFFAWHPLDGDLSTVLALVEKQPAPFRRRLVRAIEALCELDEIPLAVSPAGDRRKRKRQSAAGTQ